MAWLTARRRWIAVAAAVIAVGGYAYFRSVGEKKDFETETVARGTVIEEVSVTGSVTPAQRIALEAEVSGRVKAVHVDEGSVVAKGGVLIEIDDRDLQARVASQRAAVLSARARLDELVAGPTDEEIARSEAALAAAEVRYEAAVAAEAGARTAVENAEQNQATVAAKADSALEAKRVALITDLRDAATKAYDAVHRLTDPLFTSDDHLTFGSQNTQAEIDARSTRAPAKSAVLDAQAASASAEAAGSVDAALIAAQAASAALATVKVHVDADAVLLTYALGLSDSTKSTYQLNVSTAQGAVNVSLQTLAASKAALELQETLNAADLASAKTALDSARSALTAAMFNVSSAAQAVAQAEADLALTVSGSRREVIAAQRARVAVEEASLAALFAELAKRRIVSPIDAIITLVNAKVGEIVQPGRTVVELQAQSDLEIIANISEIDVGRLEVGDPVVITLDAFPRTETWTGSVAAIDPAERIVDGVIFYRTTVALDGDDERLRSGMTANLEIETARAEDVLRVQLRAVRERDGKAYVDVLAGGVPVEREVVLGIENNIYAEVKSGLSEGETVIIAERER